MAEQSLNLFLRRAMIHRYGVVLPSVMTAVARNIAATGMTYHSHLKRDGAGATELEFAASRLLATLNPTRQCNSAISAAAAQMDH